MYAPFYIEDINGNQVVTTINDGDFTIGDISNLTGAFVGQNVEFTGSYQAISIGTGYSAGQSGTFDVELTNLDGETIVVTYTVTIVSIP